MTDQLDGLIAVSAVVLALVVDALIARRLGKRLAWLAFVPVAQRRVTLSPGARAALTQLADAPTVYRQQPTARIDVSRLLPSPDAQLTIPGSGGGIVLRIPPYRRARSGSFLGASVWISVRADGDALSMRARAYPWSTLTAIGFLVPFGAMATAFPSDAWIGYVVFSVLLVSELTMAFEARREAQHLTRATLDQVESNIAALA